METAVETNETNEIKDKKVFIARTILFCIFGCILPFVFIAWRFEIFSNGGSHISFTGWGVIGIIIVFFFVLYCLKKIKKFDDIISSINRNISNIDSNYQTKLNQFRSIDKVDNVQIPKIKMLDGSYVSYDDYMERKEDKFADFKDCVEINPDSLPF